MDVRTICLGILTRGEATGYEIKKLVEDGGYQHFAEASFGSIYPALSQLTQDGLVQVRAEVQDKRPDRKVYSITPAGRSEFLASLLKPMAEDRHRSPFMFAMLFSHLLPPERVTALLDGYIHQNEQKLAQLTATPDAAPTDSRRTVRCGFRAGCLCRDARLPEGASQRDPDIVHTGSGMNGAS
jgi:PadR family transcriptional regulator, regulatory protein AphA